MSNVCQKTFQISVGAVPPPCPFPGTLTLDADTVADLNFANGASGQITGTMTQLACGEWREDSALIPPYGINELDVVFTGTTFTFSAIFNGGRTQGNYTKDIPSATDPTGGYTYASGTVIPKRAPPYFPGQLHITIS